MRDCIVRFERLGHHGVITGIDLLASALYDLKELTPFEFFFDQVEGYLDF